MARRVIVTCIVLLGGCGGRPVAPTNGSTEPATGRTIALRGQLPAVDGAADALFPLKVLVALDSSQTMHVNDPGNRRATAVLQLARALPAAELALMRFTSDREVLTRRADGQPGFTRSRAAISAALSTLEPAGAGADFEGLLRAARELIDSDRALERARDPHAARRTSYRIIVVTDSSPYPQIASPSDWQGIPDAMVHAMLGSLTPAQRPAYNTLSRISAAARALGDQAGVPISVVTLAASAPAWQAQATDETAQRISSASGGRFAHAARGEAIDLQSVQVAAPTAPYLVDAVTLTRVGMAGHDVVSVDGARELAVTDVALPASGRAVLVLDAVFTPRGFSSEGAVTRRACVELDAASAPDVVTLPTSAWQPTATHDPQRDCYRP